MPEEALYEPVMPSWSAKRSRSSEGMKLEPIETEAVVRFGP